VTWAHVTEFGGGNNITGTFSLTPSGVGHLVLIEICNSTNATATATALSSSNVTWTRLGSILTGSTSAKTATVFAGTVTAASLATVTITWSGTAPTYGWAGSEFSSTVGSWAIDGSQGNLDSSGTNTWPSLTPSVSGALYWGFIQNSSTSVNGTTSGYVYNNNADSGGGDGSAYNLNCASGVATSPVWGDSTHQFGVVVLMKEVAATAVTPVSVWEQPQPRPAQRTQPAAVLGQQAPAVTVGPGVTPLSAWQQPVAQPYRPPVVTLASQAGVPGGAFTGSASLAITVTTTASGVVGPPAPVVWQQPVAQPYVPPVLPAAQQIGTQGSGGASLAVTATLTATGVVGLALPPVWQQPAAQPYRPAQLTLPQSPPPVPGAASLAITVSLSASGQVGPVLAVWQQPVLQPYQPAQLTLTQAPPAFTGGASLAVTVTLTATGVVGLALPPVWQQPVLQPYRQAVLFLAFPPPPLASGATLAIAVTAQASGEVHPNLAVWQQPQPFTWQYPQLGLASKAGITIVAFSAGAEWVAWPDQSPLQVAVAVTAAGVSNYSGSAALAIVVALEAWDLDNFLAVTVVLTASGVVTSAAGSGGAALAIALSPTAQGGVSGGAALAITAAPSASAGLMVLTVTIVTSGTTLPAGFFLPRRGGKQSVTSVTVVAAGKGTVTEPGAGAAGVVSPSSSKTAGAAGAGSGTVTDPRGGQPKVTGGG
jgi:hypothetical protein